MVFFLNLCKNNYASISIYSLQTFILEYAAKLVYVKNIFNGYKRKNKDYQRVPSFWPQINQKQLILNKYLFIIYYLHKLQQ